MTRLESWQEKRGEKDKLKRHSEETKELNDRLRMGVDEERRVKMSPGFPVLEAGGI